MKNPQSHSTKIRCKLEFIIISKWINKLSKINNISTVMTMNIAYNTVYNLVNW